MNSPEIFASSLTARDKVALSRILDEEVVLVSPATDRLQFVGRAAVMDLLASVIDAYEDLQATTDPVVGHSATVVIDARIGHHPFQETLLLHIGHDGRVDRMRASIRPLSGLVAVTAEVGRRLARRRGRMAELLFLVLSAEVGITVAVADRVGSWLAGGSSPSSRVSRCRP